MSTKPVRQRLTAAERKSRILDAAQQVFSDDGFAGARTRVIAARAGITEAILYQYFASKDELFEHAVLEPVRALSVDLASSLRDCATAVREGSDDERVVITEAVTIALTCLVRMLPLLGVAILADRREGTGSYRRDLHAAVAELLTEADTALCATRAVADDPLLLTVLAMCLGPVLDARFRDTELDVGSVAAQTGALLSMGLGRATTVRPSVTTARAGTRRTRSGA